MAREPQFPSSLLQQLYRVTRDGLTGLTARLSQKLFATPPGAFHVFTTAVVADDTWIDISTAPLQHFAMLAKGTGGAPTDWEAVLEGSLDGVNAVELVKHSFAGGQTDGETVFSPADAMPVLFLRIRVPVLTLGPASDIVVTALGMP